MSDLFGPFGTAIVMVLLAGAFIAFAIFAGGKPTDMPKMSTKAWVVAGLLIFLVVFLLTTVVARNPYGRCQYTQSYC